jgi:hypothetical protein
MALTYVTRKKWKKYERIEQLNDKSRGATAKLKRLHDTE